MVRGLINDLFYFLWFMDEKTGVRVIEADIFTARDRERGAL